MQQAPKTGSDILPRRAAAEPESAPSAAAGIADSRAGAIAQRKLAEAIDGSPRTAAQRALNSRIHGNPENALQRRIGIKRLDKETRTEKDGIYGAAPRLHDAILAHRELFLKLEGEGESEEKIASQVYETLKNYLALRALLGAMQESAIDYGVIDLSEEQHLALFYFHARRQMVADGSLAVDPEEKANLAKGMEDDVASGRSLAAAISGKEDLPEGATSYPVAVLGAGASAAYYLATSGRTLDPDNTVIIGLTQPWAEERGSEGVINHPLNMIAPEYQGADLMDDKGGLAPRKRFSQLIETILAQWPRRVNAAITSVKRHESGNYYIIIAGGDTYYARRVIAGMGIGKHKAPDKVAWAQGSEKHAENQTGKSRNIPRLMDMDRFQRAIVNREFEPDSIKSIAVIGPNAAIDVMSTVLRNYPQMSVNPIYWITGSEVKEGKKVTKSPFFLKGTDNEYVEDRYKDVVKEENQPDEGRRIFSKGVITVVGHDYLGAKVGGDGVSVTFGERAATRGGEGTPLDAIKADIAVYGLGPDVAGVSSILDVPERDLKTRMEPVYDINQHFNFTGAIGSKEELIEYLRSVKVAGPEEVATRVESILGGIKKIERAASDRPASKLPPVVGVRMKGAGKASLEVIGGAAYRFAQQGAIGYDYVSKTLTRMQSEELPAVHKILPLVARNASLEEDAIEFEDRLTTYLRLAIELAEALEKIREPDKGREKSYDLEQTRDWLQLISNRLGFAQRADKTREEEQAVLRMASVYKLLTGYHAQLEELYKSVETSKDGALASTHMGGVSSTLPKNVVLGDQLTAARSAVEARQSYVPPTASGGVNLITSDHTVIATFIAAGHASIPPQLADYITACIVFDRRHLPLDKAPLPRPELDKNRYSDFTLKQQNEFQQGWIAKIKSVAALKWK